jgi:DinB superfamily
VAECLDHLNVTNALYVQQIEQAVNAGRASGLAGAPPFRMGLLERLFVGSLEPPAKLRFKAPPKFKPVPGASAEQIQSEWERTHTRLAELVRASDGLHLTKLRIPSPGTSLLKFSLFAVYHMIPAHDRRHLWQASRVIEQLPAALAASA